MASLAYIFVEEEADARGAIRHRSDDPGTLWTPAGAAIDATVENLSETGCLVRMSALLPVGTIVRLAAVGFGVRKARIVHRNGAAFGCEFLAEPSAQVTPELVPAAQPVERASISRLAASFGMLVGMVLLPWLLIALIASIAIAWVR